MSWSFVLTFDFFLKTEFAIQRLKQTTPVQPRQRSVALWLDLHKTTHLFENIDPLILVEVKSEEHWLLMYELRCIIEFKFGVTNPKVVLQMLEDIKRCQKFLSGRWFLARLNASSPVIGEIGLIKFTNNRSTVGRLQDVDIAPNFQNNGYGNRLLASIVRVAREEKIEALCLKADANDWPMNWYQRLGFQIIGNLDA